MKIRPGHLPSKHKNDSALLKFIHYIYRGLYLFLIIGFMSCQPPNKGQEVVDQSINTYFMNGLDPVRIQFGFRDKQYSVERKDNQFIYTRSFSDSLGNVRDVLVNSHTFNRIIDGDTTTLSQEWQTKYASSVNSVLYFLQLPYVLNDPAVNKIYRGDTTIEEEPYHVVHVTFEKDGGGEGYSDQFVFWFHQSDLTMDYFAYSFTEDGGGVRFRKAINQRRINGILFQDYVNYNVEKGTPLTTIPALFETGRLEEISKIIHENIKVEYSL